MKENSIVYTFAKTFIFYILLLVGFTIFVVTRFESQTEKNLELTLIGVLYLIMGFYCLDKGIDNIYYLSNLLKKSKIQTIIHYIILTSFLLPLPLLLLNLYYNTSKFSNIIPINSRIFAVSLVFLGVLILFKSFPLKKK